MERPTYSVRRIELQEADLQTRLLPQLLEREPRASPDAAGQQRGLRGKLMTQTQCVAPGAPATLTADAVDGCRVPVPLRLILPLITCPGGLLPADRRNPASDTPRTEGDNARMKPQQPHGRSAARATIEELRPSGDYAIRV